MTRAERVAERSPILQRSRARSLQQANVILDSARCVEAGRDLPDPVARLRLYITSVLDSLDRGRRRRRGPVHRVRAPEPAAHPPRPGRRRVKPFAELLLTEIETGVSAGLLRPADPERAAWFVNELVRSVYHHYAYASDRPPTMREDLWQFCLTALGGRRR